MLGMNPEEEGGIKIKKKDSPRKDKEKEKKGEVCRKDDYNHLNSKDIKITVKELNQHKDIGKTMPLWTQLALKNENSYFLAICKMGYKIIENGVLVFLSQETDLIIDVLYYKPLDCYFIGQEGRIYRKNIDEKPAYLFSEGTCLPKPRFCFKLSLMNQRIFVNSSKKYVSILDPKHKRIDFWLSTKSNHHPQILEIFGENEDKILCSDIYGLIFLFNLNYRHRKVVTRSSYQIELISDIRKEKISTVTICSDSKYACVVTQSSSKMACSRIMILEIRVNTISLKSVLDVLKRKTRLIFALNCLGYFSKSVVFLGLTAYGDEMNKVYEYNVLENELKELVEKSQPHLEALPFSMKRVGDCLYYTGRKCRIMKLTFKN